MKTIKSAWPIAVAAGTAIAGPSGNIFDEAVLGDFSDDRFNPTVLDFALGSNTVINQVVDSDLPGGDRDYYTFTLDDGQSIDSITLLNATNPTGGNDAIAFAGLAFDSIFDFDPNIFDGPGLVGFVLTTPDLSGLDILPELSDGLDTLGPGDYTLWIQQTGTDLTEIALDFNVVPAPTTAAPLLAAALVSTRRRRNP